MTYDHTDTGPQYGDCEHCAEGNRTLYQLDEDIPESPWVCKMCSNTLDRDTILRTRLYYVCHTTHAFVFFVKDWTDMKICETSSRELAERIAEEMNAGRVALRELAKEN